MASIEPGIALVRAAHGYRIVQNRPPVGTVLCRVPIDEALAQVTRLLPICGDAQRIAAARAVETARGEPENPQQRSRRDETLLREQLRSSMWRFCVDWPLLMGEAQALDPMRDMLQAGGLAEARELLAGQLGGLEFIDSQEALEEWMGRAGVTAARVVMRAVRVDTAGESLGPWDRGTPLRDPDEALAVSRDALTWPAAGMPVTPPPGEVGAMAMARHPLTGTLTESFGAVGARFLAQALDAAFLCTADATSAGLEFPGDGVRGASPTPGTGFGWAMTARGPLVHRVVLTTPAAKQASRWDVLAPTDWHFAPKGPVATGVASTSADPDSMRWWVAAFDPCAAWSVDDDAESDGLEG